MSDIIPMVAAVGHAWHYEDRSIIRHDSSRFKSMGQPDTRQGTAGSFFPPLPGSPDAAPNPHTSLQLQSSPAASLCKLDLVLAHMEPIECSNE